MEVIKAVEQGPVRKKRGDQPQTPSRGRTGSVLRQALHPVCALIIASPAFVCADWKPVPGGMVTPWTQKVTPDHVWAEYPRPQMERSNWTNLNGLWKYAVTSKDAQDPGHWNGEILVPFAPESALSGVGRLIEPTEVLWYERALPAPTEDGRTLLHFEAVDYEADVMVNGQHVGHHTGGNTPFSFDITSMLKSDGNVLRVLVYDANGGYQLHGKQKLDPGGIWYTRVSGIWQTVWMETVSARYIEDLDFTCDIATGEVVVEPRLSGISMRGEKVRVTASLDDEVVAAATDSGPVTIHIPDAKLWSPDSPTLYDLKVELLDRRGRVVDSVKSYTALREVGKALDDNGNWRFTLNGEPIFHWGPLDQGWWPDGLLTPPSEKAMLFDVEFLKSCGFNMIRKHIKVEPRRYYYDCDRLGMMMWQDQVSQGYGPQTIPAGSNPPWTRLAPDPVDGRWPEDEQRQFILEYKRMVDHLRDHPCIVVWNPYNEAWGQHNTMEVGKMAVDYDSTRLINIASGGNFWPVGDIADEHRYPDPGFPLENPCFDDYVKVVGEFGGHGFPLPGHLWDATRGNWGYGGLSRNIDELKERFAKSIDVLCTLRKKGISAGVYTQTTDVEVEINGLLTYDRVIKLDPEWVRKQSEKLLNTPDTVNVTTLLPTAEKEAQIWSHTTSRPSGIWMTPAFNDAAWNRSVGGFGTFETPNTFVGTKWDSSDIWLRRRFRVDNAQEGTLVMRIHHDEDVDVYIDGKQVASLTGYTQSYQDIPLDGVSLDRGTHTIAVHCHQVAGGQYVDVGLNVEIPR
ncbi:MAG: hypothetical protein JXR25_15535 [Pontiellaceae bacterium]|nr:hypothetical protein [Pontiellaceae bacterium]MBN2786232.1 hypothetical protein [Pontiellaceae bacterium]